MSLFWLQWPPTVKYKIVLYFNFLLDFLQTKLKPWKLSETTNYYTNVVN